MRHAAVVTRRLKLMGACAAILLVACMSPLDVFAREAVRAKPSPTPTPTSTPLPTTPTAGPEILKPNARKRVTGRAGAQALGTVAVTAAGSFRDVIVLNGGSNPLVDSTVVQFAADGRVFVAEKSGRIKVFDNLADNTPTTVADLSTNVYNYWDRGLLGMALDPEFTTTRPYIYVLYTYDKILGSATPAPRWNDVCPSPPGSTTDGCVASGRITRLTIGADGLMSGPELELVHDWCQQFPSHSMGTLVFGADGALYASGGEGASFTVNDYGQLGGSTGSPTPKNPCGDPPAGVGGTMTPPTAEGGSLRSQDLRTNPDPAGLNGSVIRIDPDTGAAKADNPLASSSDANARRIVAYGLRNPFRMTVRPGTNELWIGDVGSTNYEEINTVLNPTAGPVPDFGWPCYEGPNGTKKGSWDSLNLNICENLYSSPGAVRDPLFAYASAAQVADCPAHGGATIAGLAFHPPGGGYAARFDNALFFADYTDNCIWAMHAGTNGLPDPAQLESVIVGAWNPVDVKLGPDGRIYYVDYLDGEIHRLEYDPNSAPTARATATPTSGAAPLTVTFDGTGSTDPDGGTLAYAWDLDGDSAFDDSTSSEPTYTYQYPGTFPARLRVLDPQGASSTATVTITVGNGPSLRFLSDLTPLATPTNGWGPLERDLSNGETAAGDGPPITLDGQVFSKGLGAHAVSEVRYGVANCTRFLADVGIDDDRDPHAIADGHPDGSVTFQVWADGTKLAETPVLTSATSRQPLSADLAGKSELRLVVTDGGDGNTHDHADWGGARIFCLVGPQATISSPGTGTRWKVADTISFAGSATDPQDGTLSASALSWTIALHHCATPTSCHEHTLQTFTGVSSGSFPAPDHGYPSYLEVRLTATDSDGNRGTAVRRLDPLTVDLSFATQPTGLQLAVGDTTQATPFTRTVIIGSTNSLSAPTPQVLSGYSYVFSSWSDGGARSHEISAGSTAATYTATYMVDRPNTCAGAGPASPLNTWVRETLPDSADVDWFRFTTTSSRYARIVLGNLPADYRLDLFDATCGSTPVASSNRAGTQFEEIYRYLAAGTYNVRVSSAAGASSSSLYALRFSSLGEGVTLLSYQTWVDASGKRKVAGEILNNTTSRRTLLKVTATTYNAAGTVLATGASYAYVKLVNARGRTPFVITMANPAGFRQLRFVIASQVTSASAIGNLPVTVESSTTDASGRAYSGSLRNGNTFTVNATSVVATLYGPTGVVLNAAVTTTAPATIAAGASARFTVRFAEQFSATNRETFQGQATR
jgi:glucose/arabinose dehydrogenase/PKD repeat protein